VKTAGKVLKDYPREKVVVVMKWGPWITPGATPPFSADLSPAQCKYAPNPKPYPNPTSSPVCAPPPIFLTQHSTSFCVLSSSSPFVKAVAHTSSSPSTGEGRGGGGEV